LSYRITYLSIDNFSNFNEFLTIDFL